MKKEILKKINAAISLMDTFSDKSNDIDYLKAKQLLYDLRNESFKVDGFVNSIVDSLKDAIWIVSTDFTELFYVNNAVLELTEYSIEELFEKPQILKQLIHPEDINIYKELQKKFLEEGAIKGSYRIITKSNLVKWVYFEKKLIVNEDGQAIRMDGLYRDITEEIKQKESEFIRTNQLLLQQEVLYRLSSLGVDFSLEEKQKMLLRETAQTLNVEWLAIWMFNPDKSKLSSLYRYCLSQDEFLEEKTLFGGDYPKYFEKLKSLSHSKSILINDVSEEPSTAKLLIEHLQNVSIQSMMLLPIMRENRLIGVISLSHINDIRKWTEEEHSFGMSIANILSIYLETEEKRLINEALIDKTRVLIEAQYIAKMGNFVIDLSTGEWKSSVVFDQVFGIDRQNYKKDIRNWVKLISPEYSEYVFNVFKEVVKQKELNDINRFEETFKIIRQNDGEERWVTVVAEFQYDEIGKPTHMLGTMQDVTERKIIEDELIQAKELAESLLKTKANFLSNMSHEIRTPLNGIIGFSNLLKDSHLDEDQFEMVQAIEFSSKNLLVIVNDILDFSKMEANKMTFEALPFDIVENLKNTLHLMVLKAQEKGVELLYSIDSRIEKKLVGDPTRLNQILNNLVGNAVKFTEKGMVELDLTLVSEDDDACVINFSVVDTGIGIEGDKLELIFDSFSQATNSTTRLFGGTGLGLAITKKLIELQGGTLNVESEVGVGSVFSFSLTFKKQTNSELILEDKVYQMIDPQFLKQYSILLVEDIEVNRKLVKRIFDTWGCKIDLAENGREAYEMASKKRYDFILMDLQMPIMGGFEAAKLISSIQDVPIVALSAYTSKEDEQKCLDSGMKGLIVKPLNKELLLRVLNDYLVKKEDTLATKSLVDVSNEFSFSENWIDLTYLNNVTNGDESFKNEMIDMVKEHLPNFKLNIKKYRTENQADQLKREVHKLKSSIGILGVEKGKQLIVKIENEIAKTNSLLTVQSKIDKVLDMIEALEKEIGTIRNQN